METVEAINSRLLEYYGSAWNGWPIYRVVWSTDQTEKRLTSFTEAGLELLNPEVREMPKYRQWANDRYILEHLCTIGDNPELSVEKISYEPLFVFQDKDGFPLPPMWNACKMVVDTVKAATGNGPSLRAKYTDPYKDQPREQVEKEITQLQEDLFGNETDVTDALAHGEGVVVPSNYKVN